ncbi:MAG: metal ABC transporter permease [Ruminococcaceae bacterium]|nr:metal ABC transporter permease [Oscillospiraceae bacterium]
MLDELIKIFSSYEFMQRAVIVGGLVALCAALLGVSLVLKRYSMIGDGLSHVGFGTMAIATALNFAELEFSIPIVVISAFLLLRISENSKIKGDALIAMISTGALAIGVMVVSLTKGMNVDIQNFMFGSILTIEKKDLWLSVVLCIAVLVLYIFSYSKIFSVTFDESFAKATGVNTGAYNMLLAILTSITIVLGMRLMGALLISALIIFPPLSSMRIFKSFKRVVIFSAIVAVISFVLGIIISYFYSVPAGASIVCVNIAMFILCMSIGNIKKFIN